MTIPEVVAARIRCVLCGFSKVCRDMRLGYASILLGRRLVLFIEIVTGDGLEVFCSSLWNDCLNDHRIKVS